jgi:hypothetical protein
MRTNEEMKEEIKSMRKELRSDVIGLCSAITEANIYLLHRGDRDVSKNPDFDQIDALDRAHKNAMVQAKRLRERIEL